MIFKMIDIIMRCLRKYYFIYIKENFNEIRNKGWIKIKSITFYKNQRRINSIESWITSDGD
jgi:hypothetical protein